MGATLNRRALLGASTAFAMMKSAPTRAGGQLIVGTFGGDYGEALQAQIDKPFLAPKGIDVQQDIATQDPRKTKLIAERSFKHGTMDVATLSAVDTYTLAQMNIWDPVSAANVPNLSHVAENLRSPFSIPHIVTGMVVLYNPERVKAAPKSFADFWDPKYKGRVGLSDIVPLYNFAFAALAFGGSMTNFEPGKPKLKELRSLGVRIYPSNEALAVALKSEEIWLTPMYLSRSAQWQTAGISVAAVVPAEGAIPYVSSAAVPKNASNKESAFMYLDLMLDPKVQAAFSERMFYAPTVDNAALPPELMKRVGFTPEQQAKFNIPDYDYLAKNTPHLMDWWNRDFKG
jgi:putative spermidine/putrescine transport system substrate-binding protein